MLLKVPKTKNKLLKQMAQFECRTFAMADASDKEETNELIRVLSTLSDERKRCLLVLFDVCLKSEHALEQAMLKASQCEALNK